MAPILKSQAFLGQNANSAGNAINLSIDTVFKE